jgi:hypothetical protein
MVMTIELTQGQVAIVDDEDYADLSAFKWRTRQQPSGIWYARRTLRDAESGRCMELMHRRILNAADGLYVDHANGDGLDNRRANLRLATNSQNQANRHRLSLNTSGYRGVCWNSGCRKWQAGIKKMGRSYHLGLYDTPQVEALAYDRAAREMFGQYARLNFDGEGAA